MAFLRPKVNHLMITIITLAILFVLLVSFRVQTKTFLYHRKKEGFVVSLRVWEQLGCATSNVMNLQCWAGTLPMKMNVVEPFIRESGDKGDQVFYFDLADDYLSINTKLPERFRDLFDIEHWNMYSIKHRYAQLISVRRFLAMAPRHLIYVAMMYGGPLKCPMGAQIPPETLENFKKHGFESIREVCVDVLHNGRLRTLQEFNELIFGDLLEYGPFTVVFDEWRGTRNESEREGKLKIVNLENDWYRVLIKDTLCAYNYFNKPFYTVSTLLEEKGHVEYETRQSLFERSGLELIPNQQVLNKVDMFRKRYLRNEPYLAVIARMEKYRISDEKDDKMHIKCLEKLANYKRFVYSKYRLNKTFFTYDIGEYGSFSWIQSQQAKVMNISKDIMRVVGTTPLEVQTAMNGIQNVTGSSGRVTVAWTQGVVGAEARCIISIGGGSFHRRVLDLHRALYGENGCFVFLDPYCREIDGIGFPPHRIP